MLGVALNWPANHTEVMWGEWCTDDSKNSQTNSRQLHDDTPYAITCYWIDKPNSIQFIWKRSQNWPRPIRRAPPGFAQTLSNCYKKGQACHFTSPRSRRSMRFLYPFFLGKRSLCAKKLNTNTIATSIFSVTAEARCEAVTTPRFEKPRQDLTKRNSQRWRWWFLLRTTN